MFHRGMERLLEQLRIMAYWLFQGNPKYYRVIEALRDFEAMPWLVTRYAKDMSVGDGVLIWIAGADSGIYAVGQIEKPPAVLEKIPDLNYWVDPSRARGKTQVVIRFTRKMLEAPLLRQDLFQDPTLKSLMVIRVPNGTNYKVSAQEWARVHELAESNRSSAQ